jgi:hypothetical protein
MIGGDVEIVHRPRQIEIGVGVEALDKGRALVTQIAFDLEIRVEGKRRQLAILHAAAELAMQRGVREIGDVRGHARHREPAARKRRMLGIAALMPIGIGHHGLAAELVEGDVLGRVTRRAGGRHRREYALRIGHGPLQHLHAAHRAADHAKQRIDAKAVEQHRLRAHHVGNGDDGEIQSPRLAGRGIDRGRPCRAHASADHIGTYDEVAVDIDREPAANHVLPPARLACDGVLVGNMLVERQRMADQNGIGALRIERAVGLIGDLERCKIDAAIELQGLVGAEARHQRARMLGLMRTLLGDRRTWYGLYAHHHISTPLSRSLPKQNRTGQ